MFTLFFCQRPLNLIDLRTFVAKFCREDLRTFSADFFGLKNGIRKLFCFLDVCIFIVVCWQIIPYLFTALAGALATLFNLATPILFVLGAAQ